MGHEVDFLAVGDEGRSGDAIALRFGNLFGRRDEQTVVVIDAGFIDTGEQLVQHIKTYYRTDLVDLVVSTHPDNDHAGGLTVVLEKLRVETLWMHRPWKHTDDIARLFKDGRVTDASVKDDLRKSLETACELERIAQRRGIQIIEPFTGVTDKTGQVNVVGPTQAYYESLLPEFRGTPEPKIALEPLIRALEALREVGRKVAETFNVETLTDAGETSAENNSSTILIVQVDGQYLMFTGDAGIPALTMAADVLDAVGFDYSKVKLAQIPHHGSQRNVGPSILNRIVGPKLTSDVKLKSAYVSAAKDGAPKHPSKKVTNAFRRRGAYVYATQGVTLRHHHEAPDRGWQAATPLPLYTEVEE